MVTTILIIWATGFFVIGADRVCDTIQDPPRRASTGEKITIDIFAATFWPIGIGQKITRTIQGDK